MGYNERGWIPQRIRTSPNLGLVLGDIQIAWIVPSKDE